LPSARQKVLGKEAVADVQFAERFLPSVTLGKAFAECKIAFAVCLEHTAKKLIPVVGGHCPPLPLPRIAPVPVPLDYIDLDPRLYLDKTA
jgi:hypothetical protein